MWGSAVVSGGEPFFWEESMRNLNEFNITEEVLSRLTETPSPRLLEIMTALIKHMHDFAREVKLTEPEWLEGIKFLTRVGQISNDTRQEMILLSDTLGLSQLVVAQNHSRPKEATEQTVFGPFHVEGAKKFPTHGGDITGPAAGDPLFVDGKIVDAAGKPIPHATIDVWQADAEGFYDVQDPNWSMGICAACSRPTTKAISASAAFCRSPIRSRPTARWAT
jgi:hydroxyquinol 1,2-dioxygenase